MPMGAARRCMTVHPLDYASPGTKAGGRAAFRTGMIFCASAGLVANFGFVYLCVNDMYRASWVYHDLMQDRRAYGRVIDPEIIASLRHPYALWISSGIMLFSAALGMLLALHLLVAAFAMNRTPGVSMHRLGQYVRWKPIGTIVTAVGFWWGG